MDLTPTPLQATNFAKEQKFLEDMYTIMEVGKEQEMSRRLLQETTRADPGRMNQVLIALQRASAYTMRFEWHDPNKPGGGKHAYWTLLVNYDTAKIILDKAQKDYLIAAKNRYKSANTPSLVKARNILADKRASQNNGVVYTTGPDMPKGIGIKSFSPAEKQPKALVEAARQYGPKVAAAKQAFAMLKTAGVEVDEKIFFEATKVPQDERLEIVSLVLPYIDQLEEQVKQLKAERKRERLAANLGTPVGAQ